MLYNKVKDQSVSLLGYGCMRFPLAANGKVDRSAAFALLDEAYQNGVTYYDTAYGYHNGESEEVLGQWLKTIDRSTVSVADKMSFWYADSAEQSHEVFNNQFNRLEVEVIDFYLMHSMNRDYWKKAQEFKFWDFLVQKRAEGKIRYIGFSFHEDLAFFEEMLNAYPWDFCQIQLNYMDADYQAGLKGLKMASERGLGVMIMEPMKGGLLAALPPKEKAMLNSELSDGQEALRWVASQKGVSVILSGINKQRDIEENIAVLEDFRPMGAEEFSVIERVGASLNEKILVPCTCCEYCMPCPFGVNIPLGFKYLNVGNRYENYPKARGTYNFNVGDQKAAKCVDCQTCVSKCPQQINIPEMLKLVVEKFEN